MIGRPVSYTINFSQAAPASGSGAGRDYGTVLLHNENLAASVVRAGWATVKIGAVGKDGKPHPYVLRCAVLCAAVCCVYFKL